jgi:hypothetical protein
VVVQERQLRRSAFRALAGVHLEALAAVQLRRPKMSANEGFVARVLEVTDGAGNSVTLKPLWWRRGAADLGRLLNACVSRQNVTVDQRTRDWLRKCVARSSASAPRWTTQAPAPDAATTLVPAAAEPSKSTFWVRRNPDGTPKKLQLQLLLPMIGFVAVGFPVMLGVSRVGTNALVSVRCDDDRAAWTEVADVPEAFGNIAGLQLPLARTLDFGTTPTLYSLDARGLTNKHNTAAVRADAKKLVDGWTLRWRRGAEVIDLQAEDFGSHANAVRFQQDYAEDHCGEGDKAFAVPAIKGAVGFRCPCDGEVVNDRISFVRGQMRFQAIVWGVPRGASHDRAVTVATRVAEIVDGGVMVFPAAGATA